MYLKCLDYNNKKRFFIKENYISRKRNNENFEQDNDHTDDYGIDAYRMLYYIAERSNCEYVIEIGCYNEKFSFSGREKYKLINICDGKTEKQKYHESIKNDGEYQLNSNLSMKKIFYNFEEGLPKIEEDVLKNSVIIVSKTVERLDNPHRLLKAISEYSKLCRYVIILTPERTRTSGIGHYGPPVCLHNVREWSIDEFHLLLRHYGIECSLCGFTVDSEMYCRKNLAIFISGKEAELNIKSIKNLNKLKVLAVMNVYNEKDIIVDSIKYLISQGIHVMVFDNWSNDGTYELVKNSFKNINEVRLERFPEKPERYFEWKRLLKNTVNYARTSDYDWIIHHDADEIRCTPWKNISLYEAICFVDSLGYNAIDHTVIDFRPTGKELKKSLFYDGLEYFEFGKRPGHFKQIKAWKNIKGLDFELASSGGHEIIFDGRKVYPLKFLLKHYSLRSDEHAKTKIFRDRKDRFSKEERVLGWHVQYDNFSEESSFLWDKDKLILWDEAVFESEYVVERLSGIGIVRE